MLKVYGVNHIKQIEIHTSEQLVTQPSTSEVEMSIEKLKGHRLPNIDQILAELIKGGNRTICSEIHKVIRATGIRRICLGSERSHHRTYLLEG
jgi:hypothetical protein